MRRSALLAALLLAIPLASCATRPDEKAQVAAARTAFVEEPKPAKPTLRAFDGPKRSLAGRTIRVSSVADLKLNRGEVVLTFDDGPVPGKTPAILAALDARGVKATFLMVGQMANAHPALVREVAARGHAIGTHTQNHTNLASVSFDTAVAAIDKGRESVASALVPSGNRAAPFFRFPYLASTGALQRHLALNGITVVDPTIDSKDYFVSSPEQVRARTIAAIDRRGSGIILMHDIHQRTVQMLPGLLDDLAERGYSVVHLAPGGGGGGGALVAVLEGQSGG